MSNAPLEYASKFHPGGAREQMISALVKRGKALEDAEKAADLILDTPELRRAFGIEIQSR
jgi:hypothetical protein